MTGGASALLSDLRRLFPSAKGAEPLSRHTTWGIGGPADFYVEVENRAALDRLVTWAADHGVPLWPIGQGSNLLVGDRGVRGVVTRLRGEFETFHFEEDGRINAGAGVLLPQLSRACAERGLTGAEPFAGIPGTLGGGLMTNAGTPEGDLGSLVEEVLTLDADGRERLLTKKDLRFGYRRSNLTDHWVLSARLKLRPGDRNDILASVEKQLKRRAERQPLGTKNCGSVFKNPPGDHAARLIEAAGLKGTRVGDARISPKHANFIENLGRASAGDVHALLALVQKTVREKCGVDLELEVWPVGD
ncbi:MAG: UDP-N-acetylmuramate dehydrogenase [Elusimicrobia bacterium]|nr:UDP-N-acetylmuramate dehydrogenase [Elusimicrobiota bacterium]